jgi:catecholate siderophore receptor
MKLNFNFIFRSDLSPGRTSSMLLTAAVLLASGLEASEGLTRFSLQGKVLDPTRAPIAAARVTAVPSDHGASSSTETDARGEFVLALSAGDYSVTADAPGFLPVSRAVKAGTSGTVARDFVLSVAPVTESVTVEAPGGYETSSIRSATRTDTPLRDVPQAVSVVTRDLVRDQLMLSLGDVVRYVPGIGAPQGENNRDQVTIRGISTSADFFLDGVRDDVQYYRDLYNVERVEALKGPNAMVFGRGGGGGVINRVSKQAGFTPLREAALQGGAYGHRRVSADLNQPLGGAVAFRFNGMYESSDSFRSGVDLERYGINPTLTVAPGEHTRITFGYEHLHDARVADRGLTSWQGRPAPVDVSTYYGDASQSHVRASVNLGAASIEHRVGRLVLRNRVLFGDYDRGYQNFVPGAVTPDQSRVALTAYNNATQRQNVFDQADLVYTVQSGRARHTLLAGFEVGRQLTDNFRNTGYFGGTATSVLVPYADPDGPQAVTFRQSATDADNHVRTRVAASYVQDQVELSPSWQVVGGLRFDRFDLRYHNNRSGDALDRIDDLVSPRAGLVWKPTRPVSVYGSYSVSYLPSSGDQFSSLTVITQQLEPEKFTSYEVGAKWDVRPQLSLTTALYRLDRTNTRSTDPNDPTRIVQTGSQRTNGYELGVNGRVTRSWQIAGGYAYQDAFVTSATVSARAGAEVAQVPHHTFALWNRYQVLSRLGVGLGVVHRSDMYAAIDNTVVLPGYTRLDAAAYLLLGGNLRLQANVENLFDRTYYVNADSNTNISPGYRRALRVAVTAGF